MMKSRQPFTDIPPPAKDIEPHVFELRKGVLLWRVHPESYGATEYNRHDTPRASPGRFHPFADTRGNPVPTLYASTTIQGALAETVFHNVTGKGGLVNRRRVADRLISKITTTETLRLASLVGARIRALGVLRKQLLETYPEDYPKTIPYAKAIHASKSDVQGLIWVSGQNDKSRSIVLFGDRIKKRSLKDLKQSSKLLQMSALGHLRRFANHSAIVLDLEDPA